VTTFGRRLRALGARYPQGADALAAVVLLILVAPHQVRHPPQPPVAGWALQIGLLVPLIWRRRFPLLVFNVVAALAFAQWLGGVLLLSGDIALLIALYSVAVHSSVRRLLYAAAITEFGVALATVRWAPDRRIWQAFVLLSGMTTAAAVLGLNQRTRRAYLASLEDRAARAEREVAAAERARIARDVHDIVTHSLSVMVALTDGASYALPASPDRAADAIGKASDIGRQAISEMQRILDVLREGSDGAGRQPQPGLDRLDTLLSEVRAAGLPVELIVEGPPVAMAAGAELALFRVVQEALTNTRKHAGPGAAARIRLSHTADQVDLEITDTGAGTASGKPGGHGLTGMRERVCVYGGELTAGPAAAGGWRVHARFDPAQLLELRRVESDQETLLELRRVESDQETLLELRRVESSQEAPLELRRVGSDQEAPLELRRVESSQETLLELQRREA